jgi:hypothetical protein
LFSAPDLLDDGIRIVGQDEGPGVLAVLGEVTVDGSLQFGDRAERAASEASAVSVEKNVSSAFAAFDAAGVA